MTAAARPEIGAGGVGRRHPGAAPGDVRGETVGAHSTLVGLPAVDGDGIPAESSGVGGVAAPGPAGDLTDHDGGVSTSPDDDGASGSTAAAVDPEAPAMTLRAIFRRFWPYTRGDRSKLVLAFLAMAASTACDTYVVTMFARIVDGATGAHSMDAVWPSAVEWLVLTAVGGLLSVLGGFLLVGAAERFVFRLRHEVFAHLQRLGPRFLGSHATGDLMSRLTTDVDGVEALASSGLVSTIIAVGTAIAYAAAAVLVQWQLAVIVVALAPLMWLTSRITGRFTKTAARVERRAAGAVGTSVEQSLSNLPLVQAYGTEAVESARLDHHGEVWWRARARESRLQMIYSPITTLIQSGALLAVLIAGAAFIAAGELTVGGLFGFAAYLGYLYPPLSQLGSLHLTVTSASASCERLIEILDTEPEVSDAPDADGSTVERGHLELRGVRYVYPGSGDAGIDDVSLDVRPGQFVLVTGPSGAGKSTLTRMLLRFVDPQDGAVVLDGVDIRDRTIAAVREAITLLPQEPMLFDLTVAENIAYARPDATRDEIEQAAAEAGALEFVRDLPQGFDTPVGEGGAALSGGQRQRVAIARALLRTSPVLVLDEPTTGLDGPTARAVLEPLRKLAGGRTTIVVSHDLTPAREADLVVVLDDGRIVARGRHHELLAASGLYARLWAAQHGANAGRAAVDLHEEEAPTAATVRPSSPAPRRRTPVGLAALDPGGARTPEPVTAPLRLLARSSTTTGPTPIRPRPAPPSRGAPPRRPTAGASPRPVSPAPMAASRGTAPVTSTVSAAAPTASSSVRPAVAPRPSTPLAAPREIPAPPAAVSRPEPPAPHAERSGAPSPSGSAAAPAQASPPRGVPSAPSPRAMSTPAASTPPSATRHTGPRRPAPTTSTSAPQPPAPRRPSPTAPAVGPTHGTPSPPRPSPTAPAVGPTHGTPSPRRPSPTASTVVPARDTPAPGAARGTGGVTVPPPRDPSSGPTPTGRNRPLVDGRPARRTVADLVADADRSPTPATHRRETPAPTPRTAIGSHRA
ncbi:ATP-binding cassette domain-containing protein [Actinomycetospora endophytica]|uniref:ATP-binding cassette domain-containing protein n=1 Tax=Actinomycetospora endophytica TaxID=2291215 RepID=A0ABS8PCU7_9PSEU|nr:ABC transporter ATP-binding protein [Actinomycetospora endophytica]MCD2195979.1 ATP-binding cassette domain-containing protein [Actinomycetospora endophytica]